MEGFWGMGTTVSSYSSARRLEVGSPGGGRRGGAGAPGGADDDPSERARHALADRIEDNLSTLLERAESILRDGEADVLALAHALETHKTLSGEDVTSIFRRSRGPLVDGTPYGDGAFIDQLRVYHIAAARAHREHSHPDIPLPIPVPAYSDGLAAGGVAAANRTGPADDSVSADGQS
jgi:hypothetical protein